MRSFFGLLVLIFAWNFLDCAGFRKTSAVHENDSQTVGKITLAGKLSEARAAHSATRLPDGRVLIAGGMERNGVFFDDADIFDPQTNNFTKAKGKMSRPRVSHTATALPGGRILMVGGWSNRDLPEQTAEVYDPQTEKFTAVGNAHRRRSGHTATLLDSGEVLIAGGSDGKASLSEAEIFDPRTNAFALVGKMQSARSVHSATKLRDGRVLLTGGEQTRGSIVAGAEIFDPKTRNFTEIKAMNVARYKHDSILLADNRVLVFGGSDSRDWRGQYKSAEIFDSKTNEFTPTGEMNFARFKIAETAVLLPNGKIFIGGGAAAAEVFNPRTNGFTKAAGAFGEPPYYASATLLDDGRVLVVGGYGSGTPQTGPVSINRAWIFQM